MAKKKKGKRVLIGLKCTECGRVDYITTKSKVNTPDKLEFMKYSPTLRKVTLHKETNKLD
jgi:large subunit ribosomal protein L33